MLRIQRQITSGGLLLLNFIFMAIAKQCTQLVIKALAKSFCCKGHLGILILRNVPSNSGCLSLNLGKYLG